MPALDAAFALAEDLHAAALVGQHLEFDVPRRADVFLQVNVGQPNAAPASCCAELNSGSSSDASLTMRMPRPPPPAEAFRITG
jgi:hypothetical protein